MASNIVRTLSCSPWLAYCGLCFAVATACDRLVGAPPGLGVFWALGVGAGCGLIVGAVTGGLGMLLRRPPRLWATLCWSLAAAFAAATLAIDLGIVARFDGPYRTLAIAATLGCVGLIALGALLAWALQPNSTSQRSWLLTRPLPVRLTVATAAVAGALVLCFVDRRFEPASYPLVHDTLRWTSFALFVVGPWSALQAKLPKPQFVNMALLGSFGLALTLTRVAKSELALTQELPLSGLALRSVQKLGDFDLDGYSFFLGGGDCAPFDDAINPGHEEIPNNGVDDNCRRGDSKHFDADPKSVPLAPNPAPRSVVLITVDTLGAQRMSLYGAKRKTTPNLEKWAQQAVTFERAYTSGGWTSLAMSSLFRGLYPRRLQWTRLIETNRFSLLRVSDPIPDGERSKTSFGMPLDDPHEPLAFWLQRRGMHTVAVAHDRQSEFLDPRFVGRGFDSFVDVETVAGKDADDAAVTDAALAALAAIPAERRFFLWVHYFGPHRPDQTHPGVPKFGRSRQARYDHEVAFADIQVSRLLTAIEAEDRAKEVAIFLTADHGEELRRDGRGHGGNVEEATVRIPLVMKIPGVAPARVKTPVTLVDLFPTITKLTETPAPDSDGVDLRSVLREDPPRRTLIAETWRFNARGQIINDRLTAFDGKFKLERDNLRNTSALVKQNFRRVRLPDDAHPTELRRLQDDLDRYLEENSSIRMTD